MPAGTSRSVPVRPTHSPAPPLRHKVPRLHATATVVCCYKASAASAPTARGSALASALAIPECTHRSCPPSALMVRSAAYSCCCRARALSSCSALARARGGGGARAAPGSAPFWLAGDTGAFADVSPAMRSTHKSAQCLKAAPGRRQRTCARIPLGRKQQISCSKHPAYCRL